MRRLAICLGLSALASCASVEAEPQLLPMTPVEATYVGQTASVLYRRASVEQLNGLIFSDTRGHGTCVRSPAGAGAAADYTLLILQRRITTDFISQADDDVQILRSAADAAPCRALGDRSRLWLRTN